jgi:nucleoside-diphosphate-sugar epimerase
MTKLPKYQLDEIITRSQNAIAKLNGRIILITGATGFIGVWLLSVLARATELNILKVQVICVSRDPNRFIKQFPALEKSLKIEWMEGDVRQVAKPSISPNFVVHGATTTAHETYLGQANVEKFSVIFDGTRKILENSFSTSLESFLYLSSGAVYASQENGFTAPVPEGIPASIDPFATQYTLGHSKASAECLLGFYQELHPMVNYKIARIFSVLGPGLPMSIHYAVGNFIRDSLLGGPIIIKSYGSAVRSYLYITDTLVWLLNSLVIGPSNFAFHIGSSEKVTISQLAQKIANHTGSEVIHEYEDQNSKSPASLFYVPDNIRTKALLKVDEWTSLDESLVRTIDYVKSTYKCDNG